MAEPKRELTLIREFDAPRELLWKAWTDPKLLKKWWGPDGVTIDPCKFEAKVGGKIYIVMIAGPELGPMKGQHWPMHGMIQELVPPERLVFTATALEEPDGTPNMEHLTTVTLTKFGSTTKVTVHVQVANATDKAGPALAGMEMGWNQQMDKLVKLYKTFQ